MACVINRTTLQVVHSAYLPDYDENDWIHNPDMGGVSDVPKKYWKVVSDSVLEMTQPEKDTADDSLEYLDKYGFNGKDYKYIRNKMITYIIGAGGFSNLTTVEKEIAARWFCVAKSDRDTVYTTEQQVGLGLAFHKNSMDARNSRYIIATMEIFNRLTKTEADEILTDIRADVMDINYTHYGREGTDEGDPEGLFDYIEARTGTAYASTGLAAKSFVPDGMTLSALVDKIMDILKDGEY